MGPYCKFCGDRCFIPTSKEDKTKRDLKATCLKGIAFDSMVAELEELEGLHESEITEQQQKRLNELANEIELIRSR